MIASFSYGLNEIFKSKRVKFEFKVILNVPYKMVKTHFLSHHYVSLTTMLAFVHSSVATLLLALSERVETPENVPGIQEDSRTAVHSQLLFFSSAICSNGFPSQFNLSTTSPRSILVTWQQSITDSPIEGYTIRYSTALSNSTMVDIAYKTR